MAHYFSFLLIIFGFIRIYSISTISKVSVKAGHSLTIPCNYETYYTNHVKYLCKGNTWMSCSYKVKTNQPDDSGKFTISDDKTKMIFTVTINNLTNQDTSYYWCAVEINNGADAKALFHLLVNTGDSLYAGHQDITGFIGDSVRIWFHSGNPGEIKWCRLNGLCATVSSQSISGTNLAFDWISNNLTVTMSRLSTESSGWYYFVKGDLQMPVHLTVTEKPSTTMSLPTTHHTTAGVKQTLTTVRPGQQSSATVNLRSLIISLALLIFIVLMTFIIWFILKRHKQHKGNSSATVMTEEEVTYCDVTYKSKTSVQAGSDVIYGNTVDVRGTSDKMSHTDVDVIYSSVVTKK